MTVGIVSHALQQHEENRLVLISRFAVDVILDLSDGRGGIQQLLEFCFVVFSCVYLAALVEAVKKFGLHLRFLGAKEFTENIHNACHRDDRGDIRGTGSSIGEASISSTIFWLVYFSTAFMATSFAMAMAMSFVFALKWSLTSGILIMPFTSTPGMTSETCSGAHVQLCLRRNNAWQHFNSASLPMESGWSFFSGFIFDPFGIVPELLALVKSAIRITFAFCMKKIYFSPSENQFFPRRDFPNSPLRRFSTLTHLPLWNRALAGDAGGELAEGVHCGGDSVQFFLG